MKKTLLPNPLIDAVLSHSQEVESLAHSKEEIEVCHKQQLRPIHYAALSGNLKAMEILLKKGANIHSKDDVDQTALHWAAGEGNKLIVELLLQHGADKTDINKDGKTPKDLALKNNHKEIVAILSQEKPFGWITLAITASILINMASLEKDQQLPWITMGINLLLLAIHTMQWDRDIPKNVKDPGKWLLTIGLIAYGSWAAIERFQ